MRVMSVLHRLRSLGVLASVGIALAAIVLLLGVTSFFRPVAWPDALPFQPDPVPIVTEGAALTPRSPSPVTKPLPVRPTVTPSPKPSGSTSPNPVSLTKPSAPSGSDTLFEAENAWIYMGDVQADHRGYSGSGFVDYYNTAGSYIQWTVSVDTDRRATLSIRYANGSGLSRPMNVLVNGSVAAWNVDFPPTGNWDTWQTRSVTIQLARGKATIRVIATSGNGGPNVDFCDLTP
jgi:hypothetical protein